MSEEIIRPDIPRLKLIFEHFASMGLKEVTIGRDYDKSEAAFLFCKTKKEHGKDPDSGWNYPIFRALIDAMPPHMKKHWDDITPKQMKINIIPLELEDVMHLYEIGEWSRVKNTNPDGSWYRIDPPVINVQSVLQKLILEA